MFTVAVANQKGGVGKSTTLLGLTSAAIEAGLNTLVIDLDPQANSSSALSPHSGEFTTTDALYADARGCAKDCLWETEWGPQTWCIPADLSLAERESDTALAGELRLRKALDDDELRKRFDLCLIDCPPSVGRLVSNALIASDAVLIVTEPSVMASQGVAKILDTIETIRDNYSPDLVTAGVVINRVPARGREAQFRVEEITEQLGDAVWTPHMPVRAALSEAIGAGNPIHQHTPKAADCIEIYDSYLDRILALAREHGHDVERKQARTQPRRSTLKEV